MASFTPAAGLQASWPSAAQARLAHLRGARLAHASTGFIGACLLIITGCRGPTGGSQYEAPNLPRFDASIAAKRVLSNADVVEALREYANYKPADQFSPPFDASPLRGKPIVLTIDADSDGSEIGFVSSYDIATQTLTVDMQLNELTAVSMLDDYGGHGGIRTEQSFALNRSDVVTGHYAAENAYGASKMVEQHTISEDGIAEFRHFKPAQDSSNLRHWKMVLAPDVARTVTSRLKIRVTAVVTTGRKGELAACTQSTVQPTLDQPQQTTYRSCYVSVDIQKIELLGLPAGVPVSQSDS